jgi:hypothetical protein
MIDWLSELSAPSRYGVYVAGILLLFLVAVGVGVVTGLVFSWQLEQDTGVPSGSAQYRTLQDTMLETTGNPPRMPTSTSPPRRFPSFTVPQTRTVVETTLTSTTRALTATLTPSCLSRRARIGKTPGILSTSTTSVFGTKAPTKRNGLSSTRTELQYPAGQSSRWSSRQHPRALSTTPCPATPSVTPPTWITR